jgi:uncharacterized damage-inducible protein DinB
MKAHFRQFAAYNAWANRRLFGMVAALDDRQRRKPIGLFFGSLHGTLNHVLVADRIWLGRLTKTDPETGPLDRILHEKFPDLVRARLAEDERLVRAVESFDEAAFDGDVTYSTLAGTSFTQPLALVLAHIFNHQTHHRGQAHAGLSIVTGGEPDGLDLLLFQRGLPAPSASTLLQAAAD